MASSREMFERMDALKYIEMLNATEVFAGKPHSIPCRIFRAYTGKDQQEKTSIAAIMRAEDTTLDHFTRGRGEYVEGNYKVVGLLITDDEYYELLKEQKKLLGRFYPVLRILLIRNRKYEARNVGAFLCS